MNFQVFQQLKLKLEYQRINCGFYLGFSNRSFDSHASKLGPFAVSKLASMESKLESELNPVDYFTPNGPEIKIN